MAVDDTPAPADPAPEPTPAPATTAATVAPRTNDAFFLLIALTVIASASFVFIKKRKNNA